MISGVAGIRRAYQDADVARRYIEDRFTTPLGALLHARQTEALRRLIAAERPSDVLEIAPGPARVTAAIADLAPRLTLMDSSAEMLDEARRRLAGGAFVRHTLVRADAFHLPFRARFDFVYSFRLIRHFGAEDRQRLYGEIRRVLKPGGLLVFDAVNARVSAPRQARAKGSAHQHYDAMFEREALSRELSAAGFAVERAEGMQHRYAVLYQLQVLLAPRSAAAARGAMRLVDRTGGEPLEWVVSCRA